MPESDPALEQAISHGAAKPDLQPKDLESTLQELDKLLGKDDSIDLFSVPDELLPDLKELPDMDPFQAHTPLPDFVWDAKDDAEILAKAQEALGDPVVESMFEDQRLQGGLTRKDNVPPFMPEELRLPPPRSAPSTEPKLPAEPIEEATALAPDTEPMLEAQSATPGAPLPSTVILEPTDTRTQHADSHYPAPQLPSPATDSWTGVGVGFAFGLALGLAAGAMLYATLAG